ncbi:MAG: biotin--[acetyl-CoA-carboxylase] ligase [Dehalococcoidales bacterium]|nr:biotin--[acetyl-CoA-carboxylase] ligase [Dehalococcoidales bacterium]
MKENNILTEAISSNLGTRFVGDKIIYYPSVNSTNELAKQEAQQGAEEGTVIIAGEQVAGKGRMQRVWLSPQGSIAMSVILYPDLVYLPALIMVASLAVVYSIEKTTGLEAEIKWPNDVLVDDKKICGILIENSMKGKVVDYTVIGIGLNANLKISEFPEIIYPATSLSDELGREVPLLKIIRQLLIEIERLYLSLQTGDSVYEEWRSKLVTLGKEIRIKTGNTIYDGAAESVARDGSLYLRCLDGKLIKIVAGDASLRV